MAGDWVADARGVRVQCVGAVVSDGAGRTLMILRGHEPAKGLWSIPGGRIEPGETDQEAVVREVLEETGLHVTCGRLLGEAELPGAAGEIIVVRDYLAELVASSPGTEIGGGQALAGTASEPALAGGAVGAASEPAPAGGAVGAVAGDDAADVRWVSDAEADAMDARGEVTSGLLQTLRSWL